MQKFLSIVVLSAFFVGNYARIIAVSSNNEEQLVPADVRDEDNTQLVRQKRQFGDFGGFGGFGGPQDFGQSSAQANANAFNQYQGPDGFGSSAANAGAQSFQSQGPLGGFGASAANSQSQGFSAGPDGFSGNAGFSGSQSYNLPNGKTIALSYGAGYNLVPGQNPQFTNANSIAFT